MQIVIEIPEIQKKMIDAFVELPPQVENDLISAIRHGTSLPEHHGDLKDVDSIPEEDRNIIVKSLLKPHTIAFIGAIELYDYCNSLPTIIPATKEGDRE